MKSFPSKGVFLFFASISLSLLSITYRWTFGARRELVKMEIKLLDRN